MLPPRRGGAEALSGNYPLFPEALSGDRRLSSVCLSDVAYDIKNDMIFLYLYLLMFDNFVCDSATVYFLCSRPVGGAEALSGDRRLSSVCLSDVAYNGSNSETKRQRTTKLCTGVPQVTCDSHTDYKVKRSKVKVTGRGHIVAAT